jgi:hypothetical protein
MQPITEFEFNFDEQYENEKGVFTVLSIDKREMVIQWENGEKARTEIGLQRRIQERRQRERITSEAQDNEAKRQHRKSKGLKLGSKFEGLQSSDFKNTAARTTWRSRNQLGGAVTKQLPKDTFTFNSWVLAQRPEIHWVDVEHRSRDAAGADAFFFVRLDDLSMSYGFCAARPKRKGESSQTWESFANWLMQKENDRMLQGLVIDSKMAVYDLATPAFGVLLPFEDGWRITGENELQKVDMLVTYIDSVLTRGGINLAIAKKVPKDEAVASGKDIAADIAHLFALLMPLYKASVVLISSAASS